MLQAKREAPFDGFTGQLIAEMMAAREDFAMGVLGKRKHEAASSMPEVCACVCVCVSCHVPHGAQNLFLTMMCCKT